MKQRYPAHISPSMLILLAAQQRGEDFSAMGDLSGLMARIEARSLPIDTSPAAHGRLVRAMQQADDRKAGRVRLWVDDLL